MTQTTNSGPLRIGIVGSGFIANFHLTSLIAVRNCTVAGVYSPTPANREAFALRANELGLGPAQAFDSLADMVTSPDVDAVWLLMPNDARLPVMREIHGLVTSGKAKLAGLACEKPLGRTLTEAKEMLSLVEDAGLNHGYLENQVYSTAVKRGKEIIWRRAAPSTGRPYLARAAEEHAGPHEPWFWRGDKQGGGVLLDMMCHSVEVARYLLTQPGEGRDSLRLKTANATVSSLKWTRPKYAAELKERMGDEVDFLRNPVEDFARCTLTLESADGEELMIESTTSWAYVGAGLRIQLELLGPEYAMEFNSLGTGLKVFMSRAVTGSEGEDLVEKQNAEQGLMPVLEDEAGVYGYTDENRDMVESFRNGTKPLETFHDGVAVIEILMALYKSAETGRTVEFPAADLDDYIPVPARAAA
ncbi:MAG: Gfo/Idh/MocA family oxidoreductase [Alphaproteobacteria bacterium]|jgi:predicted dehydrogenase|nr:Gfo/Idh/MocA family oxidoreductase [Alphaproteobacteria bacterium]MBT5860990.1 Gfo/Idh/MocA family oxidoreductase [Alphaproteobacteria bacterium]